MRPEPGNEAMPCGTRIAAVPDDVEPVVSERRDRVITAIVTAVPILSLFFVGWQLWASLLGWNDIFVFLLLYALSGLGVTVGFHRLLTHRAFKTTRSVRAALAILGSAALEGPVISWVADHRKHHAFSDQLGDPHSPHVDHGGGWIGASRGLPGPVGRFLARRPVLFAALCGLAIAALGPPIPVL